MAHCSCPLSSFIFPALGHCVFECFQDVMSHSHPQTLLRPGLPVDMRLFQVCVGGGVIFSPYHTPAPRLCSQMTSSLPGCHITLCQPPLCLCEAIVAPGSHLHLFTILGPSPSLPHPSHPASCHTPPSQMFPQAVSFPLPSLRSCG